MTLSGLFLFRSKKQQGDQVSNWPGKYVIGLTGNIATGKSVVRRMLEHLSAYTIDADVLSHRAISKTGPAYGEVVDFFGKFILQSGGEIDRPKLGRIVFSDPQAMKTLEELIHPHIQQAVDILINRSKHEVVVIEAIKLLEGNLVHACDSIWVVSATEKIQIERLMAKRGMNESEAAQRIHAQSSQEIKKAAADVIIMNTGMFTDTWLQVVAAWEKMPSLSDTTPTVRKQVEPGEYTVVRGHPRDSSRIAGFVNRLHGYLNSPTETEVMEFFGDMAFLLLLTGNELVGLAGWQVENLVARTAQLYIDPHIDQKLALSCIINELEQASRDLQCEASLVFLPAREHIMESILLELGYRHQTVNGLMVEAWKDAAIESHPPGTIMFFKQLREDRVLRPI
jgi:dephospho-CoA kinase